MSEEKSEEKKAEKKCTIYYKVGWINARMRKGERFDKLDACCKVFNDFFFSTGNRKNCSWNEDTVFDEAPGLNFLFRGGELNVFVCGIKVKFCLSCGCAIEIKKSRDVAVRQKMKEVSDGYEETDFSQESQ